MNLGAVFSCVSSHYAGDFVEIDDFVEIAYLPCVELSFPPRWSTSGAQTRSRDVMEDGWTRFTFSDVLDTSIYLELWDRHNDLWLSQANHIFNRLGILSNFEDYGKLHITLVSSTTADPPEGYLFLCPEKDFQTGPTAFKWPDCPAYWSFDPSGVERPSAESAVDLGFPSIQLSTNIIGHSWDASVYAGLRQFHQAKGFDPDSQEVPLHFERPLFRLSKDIDATFGQIEDGDDQIQVTNADESEDMLVSVNKDDADSSSVPGDKDAEYLRSQEDMPVSWTIQLLIHVQLALILFLIFCGLYDEVSEFK
ncbi:hypothetical protein MVEN_00616600 [Mycena venus]|uniref:Uncharacterized protein n=1 Tax=Mycena venus TaxID=2733690 RepID=A0A8H6YK35_9AGAR|nr:hypothetical protein MVEN_00616600 [Mycena venus]